MISISSFAPAPPPAPGRAALPTPRAASGQAPEAPASSIVALSTQGLAALAGDAAGLAMPAGARFAKLALPAFDALRTAAASGIDAAPLPKDVDNRFALGIVMEDGTRVELTLASRGDELLVRIGTDGSLDERQLDALAALAEGYQEAIDGLAAQPPHIRLGGLAKLDATMLRSIDLDAEVTLPSVPPATQSLAFHLDAGERRMALDGPAGRIDLAVKTDLPDTMGTRQQQAAAIDGYLEQFDAAATRGHGDAGLMTMFKEAFSDLARTATRDGPPPALSLPQRGWHLAREDRAVMTGLADFSASVSQTPRRENPVRHNEVDGFDYQVSQETRLAGTSAKDRSVAQSQHSRLTAQYHEPLVPGTSLALGYAAETQNYKYRTIEDTASSDVAVHYRDGRITAATLRQAADQSDHVREYLLGKLNAEHSQPARHRLVRDLVATLQPYRTQDGVDAGTSREVREQLRQQALDALGQESGLLGGAAQLADRERRLLPRLDVLAPA